MKLKDFDFRIWDDTNKGYIEEIEIHKFQNYPIEAGYTFMETDRIGEVEFIKNKNDLEIELFTGLYSKLLNGECGWFFEHFMNNKNNTIEEMYIIGNIHENKELLK
ncbi:TPA: hypothetical protein SHR85_001630 [Campylobacter jejuni]|nr:hypothetical protein [Campylobacter jejuni]